AAFGGLDILIVNTGGGSPGSLLDQDDDTDERAYRSMLRPVLASMRRAAPLLRRSDQGRIVVLTARSVVEASTDLALSSVFRCGGCGAVPGTRPRTGGERERGGDRSVRHRRAGPVRAGARRRRGSVTRGGARRARGRHPARADRPARGARRRRRVPVQRPRRL